MKKFSMEANLKEYEKYFKVFPTIMPKKCYINIIYTMPQSKIPLGYHKIPLVYVNMLLGKEWKNLEYKNEEYPLEMKLESWVKLKSKWNWNLIGYDLIANDHSIVYEKEKWMAKNDTSFRERGYLK